MWRHIYTKVSKSLTDKLYLSVNKHKMEPPGKKAKPDPSQIIDDFIERINQSKKNLQAVLGGDLTDPIPLIKVYGGHVKDPRSLSRIILTLNEKVPLKDLSHLKRVCKSEVLLCPVDCLNSVPSIQEYLELNAPELKDSFTYFREVEVPKYAPKVKKQYNPFIWLCNFHPNKYYEKLVSDEVFSTDELEEHRKYMKLAFESARWYSSENEYKIKDITDINVTVVVDPTLHSVVAISYFNDSHPIQHSAMIAIDKVAGTQKGGAWKVPEHSYTINMSGIDDELLEYLKKTVTNIKYGSRNFVGKHESGENSSSTGPYLCTNYYVYMIKEPCIMCSMALVHARAKRVFFAVPNASSGGVYSKTKLQTVSSLNHHFEVFTGFL